MTTPQICAGGCERAVRPRGTTLEQAPNTVLVSAKKMCAKCCNPYEKTRPTIEMANETIRTLKHWRDSFEKNRRARGIPTEGAW